MSEDDNSDDSNLYEYPVYFEGECTCGHDTGEHGWGECKVPGCKCEAGWVE